MEATGEKHSKEFGRTRDIIKYLRLYPTHMSDKLIELGDNPGPEAFGHDAVVASEQRRALLDKIEETGAVNFRDKGDPLLPFLKTPGE